ncbi:MAG: von Willebrand factor type A domain-containing protein [Acidobacteriota bacterium]
MSASNPHDIDRLLRSDDHPTPPDDLLDRLKADVPADLDRLAAPLLTAESLDAAPSRSTHVWMPLAALLVVALGLGLLAWTDRSTFAPESTALSEAEIAQSVASGDVAPPVTQPKESDEPADAARRPPAPRAVDDGSSGAPLPGSLRRTEDRSDARQSIAPPISATTPGESATALAAEARPTDPSQMLSEGRRRIEVQVKDERGAVVPGAQVTTETAGDSATAVSDASGRATFDLGAEAGQVRARLDGFEDAEEPLPPGDEAGEEAEVHLTLAIDQATDQLLVSRESALIGSSSAATQGQAAPTQAPEQLRGEPAPPSPPPADAPAPNAIKAPMRARTLGSIPKPAIARGDKSRRLAAPQELAEDLSARQRVDATAVEEAIEEEEADLASARAEPDATEGRLAAIEPIAEPTFIEANEDALSTFALEVDDGSYGIVRRFLDDGALPPGHLVRPEEIVNAFDYRDPPPRAQRGQPADDFSLSAQMAPGPDGRHWLRVGIRGRDVDSADRPPATLIFVVDVSGSMDRDDRLGLVKASLRLLLAELRPDDRVGLVVYGDRGRIVQQPTRDLDALGAAIDRLQPGGSTNAEEGLVLAYEMAARTKRDGAITRVILCSDGVANVGRTGPEALLARVADDAARGVELTTVGFGMGPYNDTLMEQLANRGNGRYAYVDRLDAARRLFVEDLTGTLQTLAADAKAQVVFDRRQVARWRLVGYANRAIADDRFRDDSVDAGEIGAGHTVTALYELELRDRPRRARDPLATVHLRWGSIARGAVVERTLEIDARDMARSPGEADRRLRLARVAGDFGEALRDGAPPARLQEIFGRAQRVAVEFPGDERVAELAALVGRAARLAADR